LAAVVWRVPLRSAHFAEELFHGDLVVEELSVEVTWIPIEQNPAQVEHDGVDHASLAGRLSMTRQLLVVWASSLPALSVTSTVA
jgi:hypothetical protein